MADQDSEVPLDVDHNRVKDFGYGDEADPGRVVHSTLALGARRIFPCPRNGREILSKHIPEVYVSNGIIKI